MLGGRRSHLRRTEGNGGKRGCGLLVVIVVMVQGWGVWVVNFGGRCGAAAGLRNEGLDGIFLLPAEQILGMMVKLT